MSRVAKNVTNNKQDIAPREVTLQYVFMHDSKANPVSGLSGCFQPSLKLAMTSVAPLHQPIGPRPRFRIRTKATSCVVRHV